MSPPRAGTPRSQRLVFPPGDSTAVSDGIEFVRQALADWHVGSPGPGGDEPVAQDVAQDVVLVAAELLANAQRHAHGPREARISYQPGRLLLAVTDASTEQPQPVLPHRPERVGGHGLHIVDCLCADWGTTRHPDGKTVWATILTGPEDS